MVKITRKIIENYPLANKQKDRFEEAFKIKILIPDIEIETDSIICEKISKIIKK